MNSIEQYVPPGFLQGLQNIIIAILVLLVGWLIAKLISRAVEKALKKTDLDEKVFNKFRSSDEPINSDKIIGSTVYYILLVIVFILFFNILNLDMIANPLSDLISTIFGFIPAVLKAALILVFAWVLATIVKWLIVQGGSKLNLQKLFSKMKITDDEETAKGYLEKIGEIVFYLVLLLFVPGILNALSITGVSEPFSSLLSTMLAFIPKLVAAALIFAIGWFVAKIVKSIVVNLLHASGSEGLIRKLKLQNMFEGTSFAQFVGNLIFILIMIPITIAALEKLELAGITEPAISMLNQIMNMLPNILIAIVLVLFGVWLGKFIGGFVQQFLKNVGFDRLTSKMQIGNKDASSSKMTPSAVTGYIVQVLIIFFLTVQALYLIKLDFLVDIASGITAYLPNVLAAVLILGVALIIANIVEKVLVNLLSGPAIKILAGFAKYAILALAVFMALTQLGIAVSIVTSAFTLILGGLALAFGLAFGLGGKEFAGKYLRKFDETIEETKVNDRE
ncbi:MAG TPA: mechanosensitive ion channel [Lentibacillus sp.]|uniref:mechanosensitive ion channel n=1 Tax=Lentibacillus sp. TaxID=1925746 RepID=UPI002B4ADBCD|nr:mechanosensitive ion channel [Lentibacillus sp.]HLR61641.1 mechanosensitive ion channel [Lentibacillus sp.]